MISSLPFLQNSNFNIRIISLPLPGVYIWFLWFFMLIFSFMWFLISHLPVQLLIIIRFLKVSSFFEIDDTFLWFFMIIFLYVISHFTFACSTTHYYYISKSLLFLWSRRYIFCCPTVPSDFQPVPFVTLTHPRRRRRHNIQIGTIHSLPRAGALGYWRYTYLSRRSALCRVDTRLSFAE